MAELHEALKALSPVDFADVPLDDSLISLLTSTFASANLAVDTIPLPSNAPTSSSGRAFTLPNSASSAAEILPSTPRIPSIRPEYESLSKSWGKPLRLGAKENPLGVTMYKMAAHDRHGAWFARRSVHEGLGFEKWKRAMQQEFLQSLQVKGGPGAGSIRGIGADRRLERRLIKTVGKLEIYQLSAQFPGPTAPRDFVTLLLTTENTFDADLDDERKDLRIADTPRQYMVVSIPVHHPEAPPRDGIVRGQYESVEIIREVLIPKQTSQSATNLLDTTKQDRPVSRARGNTISIGERRSSSVQGEERNKILDSADERELNPVEWIMITRSDPGGGIPRFMVERGTPGSIAGDAVKFLDWATGRDFPPVEEDTETLPSKEGSLKEEDEEEINRRLSRHPSDGYTFEPSNVDDTGIISSLTSVVKDGVDQYTPGFIADRMPRLIPHSQPGVEEDDDSSDTSSLNSFASAEQYTTAQEIPDGVSGGITPSLKSSELSLHSGASGDTETVKTEKAVIDSQARLDREIARLEERRSKLDAKFAADKVKEQDRASSKIAKDSKEAEKAKERIEKEKKKREEKHARELRRLERKRESEEKKAEEKRRKAEEADVVAKLTRERDQAKRMAEVLKRENDIWRERVGDLQRENTMLVQRLGKMEGGRDALRLIRQDTASGIGNSKKGRLERSVSLSSSVGSGSSGAKGVFPQKGEGSGNGGGSEDAEVKGQPA